MRKRRDGLFPGVLKKTGKGFAMKRREKGD